MGSFTSHYTAITYLFLHLTYCVIHSPNIEIEVLVDHRRLNFLLLITLKMKIRREKMKLEMGTLSMDR